jgi:hypothetical protein
MRLLTLTPAHPKLRDLQIVIAVGSIESIRDVNVKCGHMIPCTIIRTKTGFEHEVSEGVDDIMQAICVTEIKDEIDDHITSRLQGDPT